MAETTSVGNCGRSIADIDHSEAMVRYASFSCCNSRTRQYRNPNGGDAGATPRPASTSPAKGRTRWTNCRVRGHICQARWRSLPGVPARSWTAVEQLPVTDVFMDRSRQMCTMQIVRDRLGCWRHESVRVFAVLVSAGFASSSTMVGQSKSGRCYLRCSKCLGTVRAMLQSPCSRSATLGVMPLRCWDGASP
jgi:hypothetical protein